MSRSDSESLDDEFESADEGIKGEDIDLAELGLDSDEEDENKNEETNKNVNQTIQNKTTESTSNEENTSQIEIANETVKLDVKSLELEQDNTKIESIANNSSEIKVVNNKNDELNIEGDDEVNKLLEEMNINEEPITLTETRTETKPIVTQSEIKTIKTGWDDTELSDLDDEELEPVVEKRESKVPTPQVVASSKSVDSIRENQSKETNQVKPSSSGWGWSSFLSTATSSVANVASQLGTGLNTVLETVEATIGAPDPVQLALEAKKGKEELDENKETTKENADFNDWNNDDQEWFTINSLTSKGSQLVAGSLNVLETVGKKTFETLNERDPNLKKTRDLLTKVPMAIPTAQKPNLSQLLREAKQAREEKNEADSKLGAKPILKDQVEKLTFGLFFDEFKGAANLEALEILSQQAQVKTEASLGKMKKNTKLASILKQLDYLFKQENLNDEDELEDEDDEDSSQIFSFVKDFVKLLNPKDKSFDFENFEMLINDYADEMSVNVKLDKLINAFQTSALVLKEMSEPQELFNESIKTFALITAKLVESYHKLAETILIDQQNKNKSITSANIVLNVQYLFQITKLCIRSITLLADDYSKKCRSAAKENLNVKQINQISTDIYLEASNSSTYIGDTYLLFNSIFKSQLID